MVDKKILECIEATSRDGNKFLILKTNPDKISSKAVLRIHTFASEHDAIVVLHIVNPFGEFKIQQFRRFSSDYGRCYETPSSGDKLKGRAR